MVKSPGASPERKKVKISDVCPMIVKDPRAREINETHLLNYTTALSGFETPTEEQLLSVEGDEFRHHPNEDVEQYFVASAQWGVPAIAWNIVRPAFLWKLEFCITEFMNVEKKKKDAAVTANPENNEKPTETPPKEKLSILGHKVNLIKTTPVVFNTEESLEFVMDKAKSFDGFPFTWQRLCELLTEPMRHYTTIDKFLRAVDKVINVVTTINENGGRSFGDWDIPHAQHQHVENLFFGAVDEVEMMELEKHKQNESNEEPLDMSQKSMPAPRVSTSSPNPPSFAPPTGRSPKHSSSPSSPKGAGGSPKSGSSPKSPVIQNQSPKKEEPKDENPKEEDPKEEEIPKEEKVEEDPKETIPEANPEKKEEEREEKKEEIHEEEMPEESPMDTEKEKEEEMDCTTEA